MSKETVSRITDRVIEHTAAAVSARHAVYHDLAEMHTAFRYARFELTPIRRRVLVWAQTAHHLRVIADDATCLAYIAGNRSRRLRRSRAPDGCPLRRSARWSLTLPGVNFG